MTVRVTTDTSEARALAADMQALPEVLNRHVVKIVERGALNIKNAMIADMAASTHFRQVAPSIDYDVVEANVFGVGVIEGRIGPNKERRPAAALAQFAYFGDANRGGTVRDPQEALDDEAPRFYNELEALIGEVYR